MSNTPTLVIYCIAILLVSVLGGFIPAVVKLTHRRLQLALSLVSGVILGVGMLHMLGDAVEVSIDAGFHGIKAPDIHAIMLAALAGFLVLFMLERFFCFHHHETGDDDGGCGHQDHEHADEHGPTSDHAFGWVGALIGMTVHTLIAGFALGAAVESSVFQGPGMEESSGVTFAGLGVFLGILLHKPFDSFTIIALMRRQGLSRMSMHVVNGLFALVIPLGVLLFIWGVDSSGADATRFTVLALAFSGGTFICIAASDLLPELHFHSHDRLAMTAMVLLGLVIAWGTGLLAHGGHDHSAHMAPPAAGGIEVGPGPGDHHGHSHPHPHPHPHPH